MKILDNKNYIEVTCTNCDSKLGVHKEDIIWNEMARQRPEFEVECAACGAMTEVKQSDIPKAWLREIAPDYPRYHASHESSAGGFFMKEKSSRFSIEFD